MTKGLQELINTKITEPPPFSVAGESHDDRAVITVHGELDMLTVPELRTALAEAIEGGAKRLLLDLTDVSFIDSVSLAAIVNARRGLGESGRVGVVIEEGSYAMLIFEIGGLDSVVELFHTRERAVAQLFA
jgi:anti-sigma B factor antagonist